MARHFDALVPSRCSMTKAASSAAFVVSGEANQPSVSRSSAEARWYVSVVV